MFIKDNCNALISSLDQENSEFIQLAENASEFDKEDLKNSLIELQQEFKNLKIEFSTIAKTISKEQSQECEKFITEIGEKLTPLKKDVKDSLRSISNHRSPTTSSSFDSTSVPITNRSDKTNKDFMPDKLHHYDNYSTYIQWRKSWFGHSNQNKFYNRPISTQRMHLEKLLDTVLRDTIDGQAPDLETFPMVPTLTDDQLASVASGLDYPTPDFPAPVTCLIGILDNHFNMKEPKMMRLFNYQKLLMEGQLDKEGWFAAWSRIYKSYQTSGIASMTEEERLKANLISMTKDKELKQKLLVQNDSKSLQDLIDIGRNWQTAATLAPKFEAHQVASAARISSYKRERTRSQKMETFIESQKKLGRCFRCDRKDCKAIKGYWDQCFAAEERCNKCSRKGHIARLCQMGGPSIKQPRTVFHRLGPKESGSGHQQGNNNRKVFVENS